LALGSQQDRGGTPNRRSIASAASRQRSSRYIWPITWTPLGSLSTSPVGTATAGTPANDVAVQREWALATSSHPSGPVLSSPGTTGGSVNTGPRMSEVAAS